MKRSENQNPYPFTGLETKEIGASLKKHGSNKINSSPNAPLWHMVKGIMSDPMLILLALASGIYFISGQVSDALFMSLAIIFITTISVYQTGKSQNALRALKEVTQPSVTVIRNNRISDIAADDIVVGDFVVVSEGELIPADGIVKQLNDFTVNESILTGESYSVIKDISPDGDNMVYRGTLAESGQCIFEVSAVGNKTRLGVLGKFIREIPLEKSPLQRQVDAFVKQISLVGLAAFFIIWGVHYFQSGNIMDSLLKGLTIAMSVLPEEIPVALISFMALGAWRLMKAGVIVKAPSVIEALGSASIICLDKTGTITENKMEISRIYDFQTDMILTKESWEIPSARHLITTAMWASETVPFDNMEKAIHQLYEKSTNMDMRPHFKKIFEYPLDGRPPMMTHIFEHQNGEKIIAMKGAPESILQSALLSEQDRKKVDNILFLFSKEGLRVLGVGTAEFPKGPFPLTQQEFKIHFLGLIGFYDPPKMNIRKIFQQLYTAGIRLKLITGDNPATASAIAKQAGLKGYDKAITSTELLRLNESDFDKAVAENSVFTRMFPEVKLKIIQSLKKQNEIVGMTGDGVNDGPALKAATIGIAMGKRGSEIAKEASSIILTDNDFGKMIDAVAMGRKIYNNLKKAIQYIISIHIPIILIVMLPLILGWKYPTIFTPVHIIFLELIMGPTCSIVFENEPAEKNSMLQAPRKITRSFFNINELTISISQGLAIAGAILLIYCISVQKGFNEQLTRSMVFTTLVMANILLTLVNRSFYYSVFRTLRYKNKLLWIVVIITLLLLAMVLYIPSFSSFFRIEPLASIRVSLAVVTALISVLWIELWKKRKRIVTSHSASAIPSIE
jgi:Ca2+-transporting ATPase